MDQLFKETAVHYIIQIITLSVCACPPPVPHPLGERVRESGAQACQYLIWYQHLCAILANFFTLFKPTNQNKQFSVLLESAVILHNPISITVLQYYLKCSQLD